MSFLSNGELFSWSPAAYAPLFIATFPLEGIYAKLVKGAEGESHRLVFCYATICSVIYMGTTFIILSPLFCWNMKPRQPKAGKNP